jgi:hypothetical protein
MESRWDSKCRRGDAEVMEVVIGSKCIRNANREIQSVN